MKIVNTEDKLIMRTNFVDKLSLGELKYLIAKFFQCEEQDVVVEGISYFGDSLIVIHRTPFNDEYNNEEEGDGKIETSTQFEDYSIGHIECGETDSEIILYREFMYEKFGVEYLEVYADIKPKTIYKAYYNSSPLEDWSSLNYLPRLDWYIGKFSNMEEFFQLTHYRDLEHNGLFIISEKQERSGDFSEGIDVSCGNIETMFSEVQEILEKSN